MEGRHLTIAAEQDYFPLFDLDADVIYLIISMLHITDIKGAPVVSTVFNDFFFHQHLMRRRFASHFPKDFAQFDKLDAIDWYRQFNHMSCLTYGNSKDALHKDMARKFICVREHDVDALRRGKNELTITMEDLHPDVRDKLGYSLVDIAVASKYQTILDDWYRQAIDRYQYGGNDDVALHLRSDLSGWSLLCWAVYLNQDAPVIRGLLESDFFVNGLQHVNQSPLGIAAQMGYLHTVGLLLAHDADVHRGRALDSPLILAAKNGHADICGALLDAGANIESKDVNDWTALQHAAANGHVETVALLFRRGADLNYRAGNPNMGPTALHQAITHRHEFVVRFLLMHGANPGLDFGLKLSTVLAAESHHQPILRMLVEEGSPIFSEYPQKQSALSAAARADNIAAFQYLLSLSQNVDFDMLMFDVILSGSYQIFLHLLQLGLSVNQDQIVNLVGALKQNNGDHWRIICHMLDEYDYDLNHSYDGYTLLMRLAKHGNRQQIEDFVRRGAKVDIVNKDGTTALHIAAQYNNLKGVAALVRAGAKIDVENNNGETPLMFAAASRNSSAVLTFLLIKGANPDYANADGMTAMHCAVRSQCVVAAQQLMLYNANPFMLLRATADGLRQILSDQHLSYLAGKRLDAFLKKQPENFSLMPIDILRIVVTDSPLLDEVAAYMQRYQAAREEQRRQAALDELDDEFSANAHDVIALSQQTANHHGFRLFGGVQPGTARQGADDRPDYYENGQARYFIDL